MLEHLTQPWLMAPTPTPLFIYTVTPPQVYTSKDTSDPATFNLGVHNPKQNGAVACSLIEFAISVGDHANDLTKDWQDVQPTSNQSTWTIQKVPYASSPLRFQARPAQGTTGLKPNECISFKLTGVNINNAEGPAPVFISEKTEKQSALTQVNINKASPTLQIVYFRANPANVEAGEPTTLAWKTSGANRCVIEPLAGSLCKDHPPPNPLPLSGDLQLCPEATTAYTLTAFNSGGGYWQATAIVQVKTFISSFTATPDKFIRGEPVQLAWETSGAIITSIDQKIGYVYPPDKGSLEVKPQQETTYNLTASGGTGAPAHKSLTIAPLPSAWKQSDAPPAKAYFANLALLTFREQLWLFDLMRVAGWVSSDGKTWTAIQMAAPFTGRLSCTVVPFKDNMWLIGPSTSSGWNSDWYSPDGSHWSQHAPAGTGYRIRHRCLKFQDSLWVLGGIGGPQGQDALNDVWKSDNGFEWTRVLEHAPWSPRWDFSVAAFNNQIWLCGGQTSNGALRDAWYTSDGVNWRQWNNGAAPNPTTPPWGARRTPGLQALNGQLYLTGDNDMWVMDAKLNWSRASAAVPFSLTEQVSAVFGSRMWIAGGTGDPYRGSYPAQVWSFIP